MILRLAVNSLRHLTHRAWKWLRGSLGLLQAARELEVGVQNPTPTTEALLVSEPAPNDDEWLEELQQQMATNLEPLSTPLLSEQASQALLKWRRQTRAQFEHGDWLPDLAALVQPGTTLCASIREQGVTPRTHSLLIRSTGLVPDPSARS